MTLLNSNQKRTEWGYLICYLERDRPCEKHKRSSASVQAGATHLDAGTLSDSELENATLPPSMVQWL